MSIPNNALLIVMVQNIFHLMAQSVFRIVLQTTLLHQHKVANVYAIMKSITCMMKAVKNVFAMQAKVSLQVVVHVYVIVQKA